MTVMVSCRGTWPSPAVIMSRYLVQYVHYDVDVFSRTIARVAYTSSTTLHDSDR